MINSRSIDALHPKVADLCRLLIAKCDAAGIDIIITSTYRDNESQNALYAQGRTKPGKVVTNAKAGQSYHNYRVAFDVVPVVAGKPSWNDAGVWQKIGAIGESIGLEWAGHWKTFKEFPHFQFTGGLRLADFQAGKHFS